MSNKKLSILLLSFIFSPNIGGVESHLDDLVSFLTNQGHFVSVITYQPLLLEENTLPFEKKKNLEIRRVSWLKFNLFNRLEPFPVFQILYLVPVIFIYTFFYLLKNYKKIDIIQTHGFNMAIVGFLLSILFRKPFTVNTHVSFYFNKNSLYAKTLVFILNKAKSVLVLTRESKKELIKIGVKEEQVIVYHQWIDSKLFSPKDKNVVRKKYKISEKDFLVLFTGRLIAAKGIPLLVEAAKKVKKGIIFAIVGSGELRSNIEEASRKFSAIKFIGRVEREELPYLYSAADICIFPSNQVTKTYAEGIPRVMIEALTCGTPLIATKTGGVGEVITDDVGFFIKPDSASIVQIVNMLSLKKNELVHMRKKCISHAKKEFGMTANAKIIENSLL